MGKLTDSLTFAYRGLRYGYPLCCVLHFSWVRLIGGNPGGQWAARAGHGPGWVNVSYSWVPCRAHEWLRPGYWKQSEPADVEEIARHLLSTRPEEFPYETIESLARSIQEANEWIAANPDFEPICDCCEGGAHSGEKVAAPHSAHGSGVE